MSESQPYPGTQAVLRAIALLKTFQDDQPEWSLTELAHQVALNKTTTYRLLTALESEGLIRRGDSTDTYRLGPEMIALGGRAMRANDLRSLSRGVLETLARQTREAATLEVLVEDQVLIVDEVLGGYLVGAAQSLGTYWPAHATSTGKVLLADLPEVELSAFLAKPLSQLTDKTIIDPAELRRELAQVRLNGYATAIEALEVGYTAVAAPIRNHDGRAVAALSLGGPSARLTEGRLLELADLLRAQAAEISTQLGCKVNQDLCP
jgi:DNA-binding IclR family transcriptional regulator